VLFIAAQLYSPGPASGLGSKTSTIAACPRCLAEKWSALESRARYYYTALVEDQEYRRSAR